MQELAVGIIFDSLSASTNVVDGCSANPSTGSSSVPITNLRICPKETAPLLPTIGIKEINQFLATLLLNSQIYIYVYKYIYTYINIYYTYKYIYICIYVYIIHLIYIYILYNIYIIHI